MAPSDEKQTSIHCRLKPLLLILNWLILVWLIARVLLNPWGNFLDVVFMYFVSIAVIYNSINYVIGEDGITLKILGWSYPVTWENITRVEAFRFHTAIHVADINIWMRLLGSVGGLAFFAGPQFRVYRFHSNYDIMVEALRQHITEFSEGE